MLCTKGGYDIAGTEDWTPANLTATIQRSLRLLRTDRIDVFHLHSCSAEVLARAATCRTRPTRPRGRG